MSFQFCIVKETPFFDSSCYPVEKRRFIVSTIDQVTKNHHEINTLVLRQDSWYSVLSNTRHVEVISQNFVPSTMADI